MALLSAKQLQDRNKPFLIPIPALTGQTDDGGQVKVRRPSLRRLAYSGRIDLSILQTAAKMVNQWVGRDLSKIDREKEETPIDPEHLLDLIVIDALVEPKGVLTEAEAAGLDDVVIVPELDTEVKEAIIIGAVSGGPAAADRKEEAAEAAEFPEVGSGEGAAPDGEGVRAETESLVGAAGPGDRA